jgi:hypothetical protein
MTCLTVTEYPYHKWPQICCICRYHNSVLSSFVTVHRVCNTSNTTGATCGAETAYPSGALGFISGFKWGSVFSFLHSVVYIIVCPFVIFLLAIVLFVLLRFMAFDYPFGLFKLFLVKCKRELESDHLSFRWDGGLSFPPSHNIFRNKKNDVDNQHFCQIFQKYLVEICWVVLLIYFFFCIFQVIFFSQNAFVKNRTL